jgi:F-type H+-transporting ATPase subunit delta
MKDTRAAYRYAKSLIDLAIEQKAVEAVQQDMKLIIETCQANRDFLAVLKSPVIKGEKKSTILSAVFKDKISKLSSSFLNMLVDKKREDIIVEIATEYLNQYKKNKHIKTAVVTSAVKIDAALRASIIELVKRETGSEVELIEKTDERLIGGFILRVEDTQIDASVSGKLNKVKRKLKEAV